MPGPALLLVPAVEAAADYYIAAEFGVGVVGYLLNELHQWQESPLAKPGEPDSKPAEVVDPQVPRPSYEPVPESALIGQLLLPDKLPPPQILPGEIRWAHERSRVSTRTPRTIEAVPASRDRAIASASSSSDLPRSADEKASAGNQKDRPARDKSARERSLEWARAVLAHVKLSPRPVSRPASADLPADKRLGPPSQTRAERQPLSPDGLRKSLRVAQSRLRIVPHGTPINDISPLQRLERLRWLKVAIDAMDPKIALHAWNRLIIGNPRHAPWGRLDDVVEKLGLLSSELDIERMPTRADIEQWAPYLSTEDRQVAIEQGLASLAANRPAYRSGEISEEAWHAEGVVLLRAMEVEAQSLRRRLAAVPALADQLRSDTSPDAYQAARKLPVLQRQLNERLSYVVDAQYEVHRMLGLGSLRTGETAWPIAGPDSPTGDLWLALWTHAVSSIERHLGMTALLEDLTTQRDAAESELWSLQGDPALVPLRRQELQAQVADLNRQMIDLRIRLAEALRERQQLSAQIFVLMTTEGLGIRAPSDDHQRLVPLLRPGALGADQLHEMSRLSIRDAVRQSLAHAIDDYNDLRRGRSRRLITPEELAAAAQNLRQTLQREMASLRQRVANLYAQADEPLYQERPLVMRAIEQARAHLQEEWNVLAVAADDADADLRNLADGNFGAVPALSVGRPTGPASPVARSLAQFRAELQAVRAHWLEVLERKPLHAEAQEVLGELDRIETELSSLTDTTSLASRLGSNNLSNQVGVWRDRLSSRHIAAAQSEGQEGRFMPPSLEELSTWAPELENPARDVEISRLARSTDPADQSEAVSMLREELHRLQERKAAAAFILDTLSASDQASRAYQALVDSLASAVDRRMETLYRDLWGPLLAEAHGEFEAAGSRHDSGAADPTAGPPDTPDTWIDEWQQAFEASLSKAQGSLKQLVESELPDEPPGTPRR